MITVDLWAIGACVHHRGQAGDALRLSIHTATNRHSLPAARMSFLPFVVPDAVLALVVGLAIGVVVMGVLSRHPGTPSRPYEERYEELLDEQFGVTRDGREITPLAVGGLRDDPVPPHPPVLEGGGEEKGGEGGGEGGGAGAGLRRRRGQGAEAAAGAAAADAAPGDDSADGVAAADAAVVAAAAPGGAGDAAAAADGAGGDDNSAIRKLFFGDKTPAQIRGELHAARVKLRNSPPTGVRASCVVDALMYALILGGIGYALQAQYNIEVLPLVAHALPREAGVLAALLGGGGGAGGQQLGGGDHGAPPGAPA